ncbi:hypothetical protein B296_00040708 [Ensete ventricosum]|uniref:Uncharacterized protein n=1 Tax=Ensete ventricosum TaxID=4639 RepID=A0A426ZLW7_ENSVE|nr:hypothetical protein B296_00040708 [Ensete ventricosum]
MPINMEKGSMGGGGEEEEGELEAEKRKRKRKKEKERGRVGGGQWQIHEGSDCDLQWIGETERTWIKGLTNNKRTEREHG